MRLFFLNPRSPPGTTANREGSGGVGALVPHPRGFLYPPQRLAEARTIALARGLEAALIDLTLDPSALSRWRARRALRGAEVVVVQAALATAEHDRAEVLALAAEHPKLRVIVTGVALERSPAFAVDWPREILLHTGATGFGAGELASGFAPSGIDADPARWPLVAWSKVPLGRTRRASLYLARGCSLACVYCPYVTATQGRFLLRPPAAAAAEFEALARTRRPKRIVLRDPVFGHDQAAALEFLERIARARQRVPFEIETRPEFLVEDDRFIAALARAGNVEIKLGIETLESAPLAASERLQGARLDGVLGRGDLSARAQRYGEAARLAVQRAEGMGIAVRAYWLTGLPGATVADPSAGFELRPRFSATKPLAPRPFAGDPRVP